MTRSRWILVLGFSAAAFGAGYAAFVPPSGARSIRAFEPDRLANLELRMWQAYYAKERVRLFSLLVLTLREQYHYSWTTAVTEAFHLARAAATFGDASSGYETVLPDLEAAYGTARRWLSAGFEPRDVARAELAWWVARRTPGRNDPEAVGRLIAQEYATLYDAPLADMLMPGILRAEAAALRDSQAERPDWPAIDRLLTQSYRQLKSSLTKASARVSPEFPARSPATS